MAHPKDGYPIHPFAEIFPLHDGEPMWELREDIKANGLAEKIVAYKGKVLDGMRRQVCCIAEGVKPEYTEFKGDDDAALDFVISKNLKRRHLSADERAMVAAKYATAKRGRPKPAQPAQVSNEQPELGKNTKTCPPGTFSEMTNAEAAETFNVSERRIDRAKTVLANGTPEIHEAVADSTITLTDAAKVAKQEPEVQRQAVDAVRNGHARSATAAAQSAKPTRPRPAGKPKFDDKIIETLIGKLTRAFDQRGNALSKSREHAGCISAMNGVVKAWEKWKEQKR